jgi:hypothetical protein
MLFFLDPRYWYALFSKKVYFRLTVVCRLDIAKSPNVDVKTLDSNSEHGENWLGFCLNICNYAICRHEKAVLSDLDPDILKETRLK